MKLIVGLGNPGYEYHLTPHNLGFMAVEHLADICGAKFSRRETRAVIALAELENEQVVLAKPQTFMNLSGLAVQGLLRSLNLSTDDLIVLIDDVDLPLGFIRVRQRGSAGGHNGLKSIIGALETDQFVRVRMGARTESPVEDLVSYVLSPFPEEQLETVAQTVDQAAEATRIILREGSQKAMNRFNRKAPPEEL